MECEGHDSEGKKYSNTKEMWAEEIGEGEGEAAEAQYRTKEWYNKGVGFWEVGFILIFSFFISTVNMQKQKTNYD